MAVAGVAGSLPLITCPLSPRTKLPYFAPPTLEDTMAKKRRSAKALVMTPLFRIREEQPKKGKGSFRRKPRGHIDPEAFLLVV